MFITRTPLRISFFGGGTDYPEHYRKAGGQTLGVAINQYSFIVVKRLADLFDHRIRVGYSRTELVRDRDEIQHPAVRECLRYLDLDGGLEVDYIGDLPARSGLGSSSSFTVGLLHALYAFKGEMVSKARLAAEAVHVEQDLLRERVGVQDQHICACGGLVRVCAYALAKDLGAPLLFKGNDFAQTDIPAGRTFRTPRQSGDAMPFSGHRIR